MRTFLVIVTALAVGATAACGSSSPAPPTFTNGGANTPAVQGKTYRFNFDDGQAGALPGGFFSALGAWAVASDPSAPSAPNVLRQNAKLGDPDFPRVVVLDLTFTDLTVRVRCKPEAGSIDQACGLMFRLKDSDNYYITRANALEGNVRLYHVVAGNRVQFATADATIASGQWHTLEATARGNALTVKWDGAQVISATDSTFASGKVGLWTKADSVTAFDDFEATAN